MAPVLVKSLNRLSRSSLLDLALKWLRQSAQSPPYLSCNRTINESEEEDYLFTPAEDVDELRDIYHSLRKDEKEISKGHIVDRIVDGDWRRGLSLHQLAMVDLAHLEQNDTALRWTALKVVPLDNEYSSSLAMDAPPKRKRQKLHHSTTQYPTITPATFVAALKSEISPLVKAHYHIHLLPAPYNLPILRLYISPNSAFAPRHTSIPRPTRHAVDTGRIIYMALPLSCPYIYISLSGASTRSQASSTEKSIHPKIDIASMKRIILEAVPKALSRPHERWTLAPTKLTAKSLKAICQLRGNTRPGTSGGAYSGFVSEVEAMNRSPVNVVPRPNVQTDVKKEKAHSIPSNSTTYGPTHPHSQQAQAQHQAQITSRFGALPPSHPNYAPLDRFTVQISDLLSPADAARPATEAAPITLHFSGTDVFRGVKTLAQLAGTTTTTTTTTATATSIDEESTSAAGNSKKRKRGQNQNPNPDPNFNGQDCVIDLDRVPSWLTGEMGVSTFAV